jgi:hypothetical protein
MPPTDPTTLRRRARSAAESILDNSSLRNALDDPQAEQLINWALARLDALVARTAEMSDEEAAPVLEDGVTAVSRTMRHINQLVEQPTQPVAISEGERLNPFGVLSQRMRQLVALPSAEQLQAVAQQEAAAEHSREEVFEALLAVLQPPAEPSAPVDTPPQEPTAEAPAAEPTAESPPEEPPSTWSRFWQTLTGRS